jgi:hypothetical protein
VNSAPELQLPYYQIGYHLLRTQTDYRKIYGCKYSSCSTTHSIEIALHMCDSVLAKSYFIQLYAILVTFCT